MSECALCKLGQELSENYRLRIVSGELDPNVVARQFDMSIEEVMTHVYEHGDPIDFAHLGFEYYDARLRGIFRRFNDWMIIITSTSEPDEKKVRMATLLTKELREILRLMGEIDGKVGSAKYEKELAEANARLGQIVEIVLREACPKCQRKILDSLENLKTHSNS